MHKLRTKLIIMIILSFTVNNFAAVSVSDGSAFVTKAEFASDLSNLSNRMAGVENSIDARIDSMVSAYLVRNGIWNGAAQQVLNDLGTTATTNETMRVLGSVSKSGLILIPYYIDIDYKVGIAHNSAGKRTVDDRVMGSPVYYTITIDLGIYNESDNKEYQVKNLFYGLTGEYDTSYDEKYRLVLEQKPSGIFMFFVSRGDILKYIFRTTFDARIDWWSMTLSSKIVGNSNILSGKSIENTSDNSSGKWCNNSYYTIKFGINGTNVNIY